MRTVYQLRWEERFRDTFETLTYISGYEGTDSMSVIVMCNKCNHHQKRNAASIRNNQRGKYTFKCDNCQIKHEHTKTGYRCIECDSYKTVKSSTKDLCRPCLDIKVREMALITKSNIKEINMKQREVRKELYSNRWTSKGGNIYPKINECSRCNNDFYYDTHSKRNVCDECIRVTQRANEYKRDIVRQNRMKQNGRYDETINLDKVIERYHNVCYICKEECDRNDFEWKSGVFYTGKNYPTIEHVVPISKGGTHTWCNVNLACMHCNAIKGNN